MGKMYTVAFTAQSAFGTNDVDLFAILAPTNHTVLIHGWELAQATDYGDTEAEGLSLALYRAYTTTGSGGTSATAVPLTDDAEAADSTCRYLDTTIASGGTPELVWAGAWNIQAGHVQWFTPECRPSVTGGQRIVLWQSAPTDAITMSGAIFFEEV